MGILIEARLYLGTFAIALLLPTGAVGQELPSPGERVRVWGPVTSMDLMVNEKREAELSLIRGDTLVFEMPRSGTQVAVTQDQIRRLDVRRSRSSSRGAWLGAAAGLAIGVVAGLVYVNVRCSSDDVSCSGPVDFNVAVIFGGVGAGIGAVVGHTYPGKHWEPVNLER
jgi:hypothetical protein